MMDAERIKLLLVEDDKIDYMAFARFVRDEGLPYDYARAASIAEGREALQTQAFDVVLLDYMLGDGSAFDLFEIVPDKTPIVIVTGSGDEEIAVQAMKAGASDYLIKDPEGHYLKTLPITVRNAIKAKRAEEALIKAHMELERKVEERTAELKNANLQLQMEIEQRKTIEQALRESEERFRALTETTSEWIWEVNAEGVFTYVSPIIEELLGYLPEEVIGKTPFDLVPPAESRAKVEEYRGVFRTHKPFRDVEYLSEHKHGHSILLETSGVPFFDLDGRLCGYRGIGRDITERTKAKELLIQSERVKAVAELSAGVAHNFNNLLQVVLSCCELASFNLDARNYENLKFNLDRIAESCRFGAETVKRLENFAGAGSEVIAPKGRVFCLSKVAEKAIELSEPWWKSVPQREGLNISLKTLLPSRCLIRGQENEILEVILNLIKNAAEALPAGGEIGVRTFSEANNWVLEVQDNGVGIPQNDLRRVFEPFFTTKGYKGTGMGLASSYGIIARHGGEISVSSEKGKGTKFTVKLPVARDSRDIVEEQAVSPPRALRALVIDDQALIVDAMGKLFQQHGHVTFTAQSGPTGIEIFNRESLDLVICDLSMPFMTGWQVAETIKYMSEKRGAERPLFLMLTGWGEEEFDEQRMIESGVDGFVQKPVNFRKLIATISDLIHKRGTHKTGFTASGAAQPRIDV
jgi:two-component system cell cycle sensor histidine kinase/response regulator CckA